MSGQTLTFATVEDIIAAALGKTIGAANQRPTELQNAALIRELEDVCREFHRKGRRIMRKPFWWMEKFEVFKTYDRTTIGALTEATTPSAVIASATGWPTTGRFYVEDGGTGAIDFIDFTGRSSTTVTLTPSTIDVDHAADQNAELLYAAPTDIGEFISMVLDRVPYYPSDPIPLVLPFNPYFTFNGAFFLFPKQVGNHTATLRYWKKPAVLSTGSDSDDLARSTDIPIDYRNYAILRMAAIISKVRKRYDMEQSFNNEAEAKLMEYCQFEVNSSADPFATIGPSW